MNLASIILAFWAGFLIGAWLIFRHMKAENKDLQLKANLARAAFTEIAERHFANQEPARVIMLRSVPMTSKEEPKN